MVMGYFELRPNSLAQESRFVSPLTPGLTNVPSRVKYIMTPVSKAIFIQFVSSQHHLKLRDVKQLFAACVNRAKWQTAPAGENANSGSDAFVRTCRVTDTVSACQPLDYCNTVMLLEYLPVFCLRPCNCHVIHLNSPGARCGTCAT